MRALLVLLIVSSYSLPATAQTHAAWTRVQALEPGSEIVLTVTRDRPVQRYVIAVEDDSIRVLNLTGSTLRLTDTIRSIASRHPEYFETYARSEVAEIATHRRGRGFWGRLGPLGGYFVGGMAGGLLSGVACQAVNGRDRCDTGAFLVGMVGGGLTGFTYGWHAAGRVSEEIVYRAP